MVDGLMRARRRPHRVCGPCRRHRSPESLEAALVAGRVAAVHDSSVVTLHVAETRAPAPESRKEA
jgi:hypothetical protein